MSGTIHTDPNLPSEERDRIFLEKLRVLPNEELARNIEGYFCAPNPHYVNEAARRLKQMDEQSCKAIIFARGERNLLGFVMIEDNGEYLFGSRPQTAKPYASIQAAEDAIVRMIAFDQKHGAKSPVFTVLLMPNLQKG